MRILGYLFCSSLFLFTSTSVEAACASPNACANSTITGYISYDGSAGGGSPVVDYNAQTGSGWAGAWSGAAIPFGEFQESTQPNSQTYNITFGTLDPLPALTLSGSSLNGGTTYYLKNATDQQIPYTVSYVSCTNPTPVAIGSGTGTSFSTGAEMAGIPGTQAVCYPDGSNGRPTPQFGAGKGQLVFTLAAPNPVYAAGSYTDTFTLTVTTN